MNNKSEIEKLWLFWPIQPLNRRTLIWIQIVSETFILFCIALIFKGFFSSHVLSNIEHMFPFEAVFWYSSKFLCWPTGSVVMFLKYLWIIPWFATVYSEKHLWTESRSVQDTTMNKRHKGISNGACGKEWKANFSYTGRAIISMSQGPNHL